MSRKEKVTEQYRQGDVFIERIDAIPEGFVKVESDPCRGVVLAEGEVTGHYHAIKDPNVDVYQNSVGKKIFHVKKSKATLTHDEHGPIEFTPGFWESTIQREYSPEAIRNVRD